MDQTEYETCVPVTAHATNPNVYRAFVCDVAGTVAFVDKRGNADTITCLAGVVYRIATTLITGGTATGVHGLN